MQKEKSIGRNILIIFLIIVMIASVCAALFAWAKYQTTINGTATGETAKWSFKVSDGDTSTQEIELPMTRKDNNTSVATGKIAPGTYGEIEIGIDATGTETALTYVIEGKIGNLPTNIKFYSDAERTLDLTVLNNKFSKGGYMKLNEIGVRAEKIYWEWPFETETKPIITDEKLVSLGINKTEFDALITEKKFAEANDIIDTAENEKQFSMLLSVTGKQLNGNPVLADLVQVGDYVNYNASNTVDGQSYSYTTESTLTGSSVISTFSNADTFNSSAKAQWGVLSVDRETKTVQLMSTDATTNTVTLAGNTALENLETVLNGIGAVYGHGKGATNGRSIKLEDVEQYSTYNPYDYKSYHSSTGYYGGTRTYSTGNFYKEIKDGNGIKYETSLTDASTEANGIEMTQTFYGYGAKRYFVNSTIYNMLFRNSVDISSNKSSYWIGSFGVYLYSKMCNYSIYLIHESSIYGESIYESNGGKPEKSFAVVPVVTLEQNIQTSGQDSNGVWQLDV